MVALAVVVVSGAPVVAFAFLIISI
jgi:hypothetical protein